MEMTNDSKQTETDELKEQISNLETMLTNVQPLIAIGELAGTTAHEFNNILTLTINYARMGLRHNNDDIREKAFNKIIDASNRATKIVSVILGLARNRKSGKEATDLTLLVEDVLLLLERELIKYKISIEKRFLPIKPILANGNQIQQVLINLLVNARQASPNGGRLLIKLRPCEDTSQFVEMSIRDFGVGISQDKLPHIFETFYSTKKGPDETGKGGTGLGLALCKRIIEEHLGKIRVESTVGKGTAFIIKLPIAPED